MPNHPHMKCPRCLAKLCLLPHKTPRCKCGWESGKRAVQRGR